MDIQRKSNAKKKMIQRAVLMLVGLIAVGAITLGLRHLQPAAPTADAATLWPGTVEKGDMIRQVRGLGTLVPEDIVWIPAVTDAHVDKLNLKAGAVVKPDTIIMELSDPQLQQNLLDAEAVLKGAESALSDLKVTTQSNYLSQKAQTATIEAQMKNAILQADTDRGLNKHGLVPDLQAQKSDTDAKELQNRYKIEQERLKIAEDSIKSQLDVQQTKVDQARELYNLRKSQVGALHVRAGMNGKLTLVNVEVGQHVTPGFNLARVADPNKLKAELKIAETQAKDIAIGQEASIDTRNGIITGKVIRMDLAAQNGTVTVDTSLEGELPKGARPDLNVEGTITLERLNNIVYVGRPVHGQENSTVGLFKYSDDMKSAARVQVKLGRASVNTIEVLDGTLRPGDKVVLSDTSQYDNFDRIRISG
jgi:HlyD family secretion protein